MHDMYFSPSVIQYHSETEKQIHFANNSKISQQDFLNKSIATCTCGDSIWLLKFTCLDKQNFEG